MINKYQRQKFWPKLNDLYFVFLYICHSGLVVRALDLGPEVPGSNLLLEATKFPPSTYSQTECMLNSTILKEQ